MIQTISTHHNIVKPMTKGDRAYANALAKMVKKQESNEKFVWNQDDLNIDIEELPVAVTPAVIVKAAVVPPVTEKVTEIFEPIAEPPKKVTKGPKKTTSAYKITTKKAKVSSKKVTVAKKKGNSSWSWNDVIR